MRTRVPYGYWLISTIMAATGMGIRITTGTPATIGFQAVLVAVCAAGTVRKVQQATRDTTEPHTDTTERLTSPT